MTIEDGKAAIDLRDRLKELYKEVTFKEVFVDGYFKEEAARIAQAMTNPSMQDEIDQRSLDEMIKAIGHIQNYLLNVVRTGNNIEAQMSEQEAERLKIAEDAEKNTEVDPITGDEYEVEE